MLRGPSPVANRRRHVLVAERLRPHPGDQPVGDLPAHGHQRRLQHGDVDALALPRAGAPHQRRSYGKRRRQSADGVGDGIADPQRRARGVAGDAHDAGEALHDLVIGRIVPQRSVLPEAGNGAVDEAGLQLAQRVIAEPEPLHHSRPEILDDDIGGAQQAAEHLLAGLALEIDGDRTLAGVLGEERRPHQRLVEGGIGAELAREIAHAGRLHLDDLGAQQRELIGSERPCEHIGEIEDANAAEKPAHHPPGFVAQSSAWSFRRAAYRPSARKHRCCW
jgi:hypothetical protein